MEITRYHPTHCDIPFGHKLEVSVAKSAPHAFGEMAAFSDLVTSDKAWMVKAAVNSGLEKAKCGASKEATTLEGA